MTSIGDAGQLRRASYRDAVLRRWSRGRLVLIGDAAHSMSPQLGQGVNMALMDALALRDALRCEAGVDTAVARATRSPACAIFCCCRSGACRVAAARCCAC